MAVIPFHEILSKGGGNIYYIWHVHGYPWCVTNHPDVVTCFNAGTTNSKAHRRYIFGSTLLGGNYIAEDKDVFPIFPTLHKIGAQSFESRDTEGILSGGGYSIEIADLDLGQYWTKWGNTDVAGGDQYYGLPGLHSITFEQLDANVGWGYINTAFLRDDTTLYVDYKDSGKLHSRISGDYRLLWVGQECIAVNSSSSADGVLTMGVTARGVLRSREQDHFTENYIDVNPVVKDTPGAVRDFPSCLWAVVLNSDHTDFLSSTPYKIRPAGKVLNAETKKGITRVTIGSPFQNIDNDFRLPTFEGHLSRYVFTRHTNSGTTLDSVHATYEAPHLVIREFPEGDEVGVEHYIWLCEPGGSVVFDNWWDVVQAVEDELYLCSMGSSDQKSGTTATPGDPFEYVTLDKNYSWDDGATHLICREKDGDVPDNSSLLSGPCAWLFNLGELWQMNTPQEAFATCNNASPWFFYSKLCCLPTLADIDKIPWMICDFLPIAGDDKTPDNYMVFTGFQSIEQMTAKYAQYYYGWKWSDDEITAGCDGIGSNNKCNYFRSNGNLYFEIGTDLSGIDTNDVLFLGNSNDIESLYYQSSNPPRFAQFTVKGTSTVDGYPTIDVDDSGETTITYVSSYKSPFNVGTALYYVPAFEQEIADIQIDTSTYDITLKENDVWRAHLQYAGTCSSYAGIFRALLGETGSGIVPIANAYQFSHVIGFTDETDLKSIIDWDEIVDASKAARDALGVTYKLNIQDKVNILKMLKNELLFHGLAPTWEWRASETPPMFKMGVRHIGVTNASESFQEGRELTESMIKYGESPSTKMNYSQLANAAEISTNYNGDKHMLKLNVEVKSAHVIDTTEDNKISIESYFSHITQSVTAYNWFSSMVRALGTPIVTESTQATIGAMTHLAIGKGLLITDRSARIPYSHKLGMSQYPGQVCKMNYDLDKNIVTVEYRLAPYYSYGWAPAAIIDADHSTKAGSGVINCTTELREFNKSTGPVDCMLFDCYSYSPSTNEYSMRSCSCTDYKIIAVELDTETYTPMRFDVTSVAENGTISLLDRSNPTNYNLWDTTKRHVIFFDSWDNCQPCQKKWVFFADGDNTIGASSEPCMRWV